MSDVETPVVSVISLGGTIAMTEHTGGAVSPQLSADDLLSAIPQLKSIQVRLRSHNFRLVPGASLSFDDIIELASLIDTEINQGAQGIVITQGTDTIEETAFFLDLITHHSQPLVVTGAMRNPSMAGTDGPGNLMTAITVAASSQYKNVGCVVVMSDEIHAARYVRKTHSVATSAFSSPNSGPIGRVTEGRPYLVNPLKQNPALPLPITRSGIHIPIVTATLGDEGTFLTDCATHANGLVISGFGAGHVPASWLSTLDKLTEKLPVVLTSRTGAGPVLLGTYDFPGSEKDLYRRGVIAGGILDPIKARVLLYTLLASQAGKDDIRFHFEQFAE